MARRSVVRRGAAPRRRRQWARTSVNDESILAGGTAQFNLTNVWELAMGGALPVGVTIGRVRLDLEFARTTTPGDPDSFFGGILVAPRTVDTVDIAPGTNPHLDWMWWRKMHVGEGGGADVDLTFVSVDVKSMRRMDEIGQGLFFVVELAGTLAGTLDFGASSLMVLP
jgi:hypothetical protein